MRPIPPLPAGRFGVVTLAELLAAGWTPDAVRHAARRGELLRVAPGRFAQRPPDDLDRFRRADLLLLQRAIAATLPGDRVALSHLAAALHRSWPVWAADGGPCVSTWDPAVRKLADLHLHRLSDTGCLVRRGSVAVTSASRTLVDIAREFGTEAALVSGDAALRKGDITLESLEREVGSAAGMRGIESARQVGRLLDPLAESPLESRSRWSFDLHGIDQPASQVRLYTLEGRFLGRVDHFWPEGVVGEADGEMKYRDPDDPDVLVREKRRQRGLEDVDLEVTRWDVADLRNFAEAAGRIERARLRARRRLAEGDLRWRAVYPDPAGVRIPGVKPA